MQVSGVFKIVTILWVISSTFFCFGFEDTRMFDLQKIPYTQWGYTWLRLSGNHENVNVKAPGNQTNPFYELNETGLSSGIQYGKVFPKNQFLSLSVPILIDNRATTKYLYGSTIEGQNFTRNQSGLGDPLVQYGWAPTAYNSTSKTKFAGIFKYSPSTGTRTYPSTSKTGNYLRGGDFGEFKFLIKGQTLKKLPAIFFLRWRQQSPSKGTDLLDNTPVTSSSFSHYGFGVSFDEQLHNSMALVANIELGQRTTLTTENLDDQIETSQFRYASGSATIIWAFSCQTDLIFKVDITAESFSLNSGSTSLLVRRTRGDFLAGVKIKF